MRPVTRSESSIQRAVIDYARSQGCLCKKMEVGRFGSSGWPDYLVLYDAEVLFIEFKRKGLKPTPLQESVHQDLRAHGFNVYVVDDVEYGKNLITDFINGRL